MENNRELFDLVIRTSEARNYWFNKFKEEYLNPQKVTKIEIINNNSLEEDFPGIVYSNNSIKSCEIIFEDDMKTLKIFI